MTIKITPNGSFYNHRSLDLIVNIFNVTLKMTSFRKFIITEMALVSLDLIVNIFNVTLKMTLFRAFIITEMALVSLDLLVNIVNVSLKRKAV